MKHELLRLLTSSTNQYISGQEISDQLSVSRTAVWKHMEDLRQEGYVIDAAPRRGYRLVTRPNKLSEAEIKTGLSTKSIGQRVVFQPVVTSTQDVIKELYRNGAPHGTIVVTDEQSRGRGRMMRPWQTPNATSVMFSVLVLPKVSLQIAPQLTLVTAVAIAKAIEQLTLLTVSIKWPNDLYIGKRKLSGILTEVQAESDQTEMMVTGIGMNVNETEQDIRASGLEKKATSLLIETGREWNRRDVLQAMLQSFEAEYDTWIQSGFQAIQHDWEKRALLYGEKVTIRNHRDVKTGVMEGITADGVLKLRDEKNELHLIYSGDLE